MKQANDLLTLPSPMGDGLYSLSFSLQFAF